MTKKRLTPTIGNIKSGITVHTTSALVSRLTARILCGENITEDLCHSNKFYSPAGVTSKSKHPSAVKEIKVLM